MKILTLMMIFVILILVLPTLSGEKNSELSKGDERQKKIFKEAAVGSWYSIILYVAINFLANLFFEDYGNSFDNYVDILIIAIVGYIAFYFIGSKKVT